MVSRLEWFFDLRPGDLRRTILLTLYYFLIISTQQVVRDALFLGHFKVVQLPYVDFAVAAIIGAILGGIFGGFISTALAHMLGAACFSR